MLAPLISLFGADNPDFVPENRTCPCVCESLPGDDDPDFDPETCSCKGKKLHGRVKVVDSPAEADFNVQVVDDWMVDLKVEKVDAFADECGEWQFVDEFPDFTIMYVDGCADFTIRFVDIWCGVD